MTGPSLARLLSGLVLAALVTSCGGDGSGVDPAADAGAASAVEHGTGSADSAGSDGSSGSSQGAGSDGGATTTGTDVGDGSRGNPGGPGGDPGDSGTDVRAEGNPGAPGDVSVFEERGVTYAEFRDGSAQRVCVEQKMCSLAPPRVVEGSHSDPTECPIESMDYSPPAHDGAQGQLVFPEGATVTVNVSCLRFSDPDGDGIPGDASAGTDGTSGTSGTDGTTGSDGTTGTTGTTGTDSTTGTTGTGDQTPGTDTSGGTPAEPPQG